ncbi:6579_t:CDS:1, partial [Paraglomus brasilianum]
MNFGKWESELAKDKNAVDCHGHLHIYLKLETAKNMEEKYKSMHCKLKDPYNYDLLDCAELETLRLHSSEIPEIKKDVKEIKKRLDQIDNRLNNMDNKFNNRLNNMDNKFNNRLNNMDNKFNNRLNNMDNKFNNRLNNMDNKFNN